MSKMTPRPWDHTYEAAHLDEEQADLQRSPANTFFGARAKLTIASVDVPSLRVPAQYNPKELQLTQPVGWTEQKPTNGSKRDALAFEFSGAQPQTTQIELLFDGFEQNSSVQPKIDQIKQLATVRDEHATTEELARPHLCVITWGTNGMPPLICVIESIVTKYLMFGPDGKALRATCTVSVKECHRVGKTIVGRDGKPITLE